MLKQIVHFFSKTLRSPGIRKKVLITALILLVFRLAAHIPAAGIDRYALRELFLGSPFLSLLDVFSGGTLANFSIMALGLNPYITASIIFSLLIYVVPSLEELAKEGEYGQEKINQYTRFLTVPLAALQAFAMYFLLRSQGIIFDLSFVRLISLVLTMTAGTVLAVWMGELISEYGFKDGVSFLIFVGIVARLPVFLAQSLTIVNKEDFLKLAFFVVLAVLVLGLIVFVNEATRRIPISHARKISFASAPSYLPLRLNQAGVVPIIFAVSLVLLPSLLSQFLAGVQNARISNLVGTLSVLFNPSTLAYNAFYFLLIVGFSFFYTSLVFNPEKISENLQKGGSFIPGIRPGKETSKYLSYVLNRITSVGALFLGLIATLPFFFQKVIGVSDLFIGGTGILIVVSVVLQVTREIEGDLVMRRYEGFVR